MTKKKYQQSKSNGRSTHMNASRKSALHQAVVSSIESPRSVSSQFSSSSPSSPGAPKRPREGGPTSASRLAEVKCDPGAVASSAPFAPHSEAVPLPLDIALQSFLRLLSLSSSEISEGERVLLDLHRSLAPLGLRVQVFGSWCTGLRIPSSDMDFVALPEPATGGSASQASRSPLQRLAASIDNDLLTSRERARVFGAALRSVASSLRSSRQFHVSSLILHAKVPIVKARHAHLRTEVDISFHKDGIASSQFLCEEMKKYRLARGLILLVKALVVQWGLNEPSNGGLGSFPIAIMVLWFLRKEVAERYPPECRESCAICLVGFLRFYGEEFNYTKNAIDYPNQRFFAKPPSSELYIVNPIIPHKNCAAAAFLFHSRVVPKFRETFKQLSGLLNCELSLSTAENTVLSLLGNSVEALGDTAAVQKMMRKQSTKTVTTDQNLWDSKTSFYIGDVIS